MALSAAGATTAPAVSARAQTAPPAATVPNPTPPAAQQKAEEHYKRARELYSQGSYREARGELEAAHGLDPNAKELVFNLGVVNEKLGNIDDALKWFRGYTQMDVTAQEKQKADGFIKRLEGARKEVPPTPPPGATQTPKPPDAPPPPPQKGRIDAATITAGSVALIGLGVGGVFGVKALTDRPTSFVTGRDGTYADLQQKTSHAHNEAIIADVGLGIGVVAAAVTAYLYFARPKVSATSTSQASTKVSVVPVPDTRGGGVVMLRGSF